MRSLRDVDPGSPIDRGHWSNVGLLAWWLAIPGRTGGSTWPDLAGRSDLALSGFTAPHGWQPASRPGAFGQLDFNATAAGTAVASVSSPALDNWSTLTIAFWARFTSFVSFARVMEKGANNEWTIAFNASGQLGLQIGNTNLVAGTATGAVDGLWHHYIFTISAGPDGACWWDGVLQPGGGGGGITPPSKTNALAVGQFGGGSGLGLVGQLDDIRIYGYQMAGVLPPMLYDLSRRMYPGALSRPARRAFAPPLATLAAGTASFVSSGPGGISLAATPATGGSPGYTEQWQRNVDGGSYTNLSNGSGVTGARTLSLLDGSATAGHLYGYRLVYTDAASASATSNAVAAAIYPGGPIVAGSRRAAPAPSACDGVRPMIFKNAAAQRVWIYASDASGNPKAGDAANITATVDKDGGGPDATATAHPTESGGGLYWFPLAQAETDANSLGLVAASSTSGVTIDPVIVYTQGGAIPFVAAGQLAGLPLGDSQGRVTVVVNADKSGYSLAQAFPGNFAALAITSGGAVTGAGNVPLPSGTVAAGPAPAAFSAAMAGLGSAVASGDLVGRRLLMTSGTRQGDMTDGCQVCTISGQTATFTFAAAQRFTPAEGDTFAVVGF